MKIKTLLRASKNWTKNSFARNNNNRAVAATSPDAVKWCLTGAANKCYSDEKEWAKVISAIRRAVPRLYHYSIIAFNDSANTTHKQVLAVVTKANV